MAIKMVHHMLLSKSETIMCTTCKQFKGFGDNMYLETYQSGAFPFTSSEVTATVCEPCHKKEKK